MTNSVLQELEKAIVDFLESFILVFDVDWEYSKICLEVRMEDDGELQNLLDELADYGDWTNRDNLITSYQHLQKVLEKCSIHVDY